MRFTLTNVGTTRLETLISVAWNHVPIPGKETTQAFLELLKGRSWLVRLLVRPVVLDVAFRPVPQTPSLVSTSHADRQGWLDRASCRTRVLAVYEAQVRCSMSDMAIYRQSTRVCPQQVQGLEQNHADYKRSQE